MNKKINFSIPISKVDDEQRMVYGIATAEVLDHQNEIVDYNASKKAFSEWKGNIREMHRPDSAIGKTVDIQYDDDNKSVVIGAYISKSPEGESAWTKVKEGILTGFSIGGRVFATVDEVAKSDKGDVNAKRITDYELAETSLVDSPACPVAEFLVVKSRDGKKDDDKPLEMTEKMIEHPKAVPVLGWQKAFTYSIAQLKEQELAKANQVEVKEFEKVEEADELNKKNYSDKDRKAMADKGQALPDGSFPIANVQDLKNAIKAIGRAKDPAKAKAHIKTRAKALGQSALIPDTWKADKTDDLKKEDEVNSEEQENEQSNETSDVNEESSEPQDTQDGVSEEDDNEQSSEQKVEDENGDTSEEASETGDEQSSETEPTADTAEDTSTEAASDEQEVAAPEDPQKADKNNDLRKDLYTVSSLADCLAQLNCIRDWCVMEQEWEGDDSTVPADLTAAIETLGGILQAMAQEEAAEAVDNKTGTSAAPMALADQGADLKKFEANMLSSTQELLDKQAELIFGKVAEMVKPLADRVNELSHQPATGDRPVASFIEVEKGVGTPAAPRDAGADQNSELSKRWTELKEIAATRKNDPSFTLSERQKLVDEMWTLNKKLNNVETKDLNPALVASHPYAFKRLS